MLLLLAEARWFLHAQLGGAPGAVEVALDAFSDAAKTSANPLFTEPLQPKAWLLPHGAYTKDPATNALREPQVTVCVALARACAAGCHSCVVWPDVTRGVRCVS